MDKDKKRRTKTRTNLTSAQEVKYHHTFKAADRAGGYKSTNNPN